jgi:hypothetical protein
MGNINNRVKELSPHVISIRFTDNLTVVDCAFKNGWSIPPSDKVGNETTPDKPNYYMLYPLKETYGVDEILDYVDYIIKVNIERELKIQLLQIKINELKDMFTKFSLDKCKTIEFQLVSDLNTSITEDIDISEMPIVYNEVETTVETEAPVIKNNQDDDDDIPYATGLGDDKVEHSGINNVDPATARFNNETFDLPPKKNIQDGKIVVEGFDVPEVICKCDPQDPNQVCPACYV